MAQGLLSSLANVAVGRATPIDSGLTAEQEAEQRRELAKALVHVAEAETRITVSQKQLGMEAMESWFTAQTGLANNYTNLVEAIAAYGQAAAMNNAATADLIGQVINSPRAVRLQGLLYGDVPTEATKDFREKTELRVRDFGAALPKAELYMVPGSMGTMPSAELQTVIGEAARQTAETFNEQLQTMPADQKVYHETASTQYFMNGMRGQLSLLENKYGLDAGTLVNAEMDQYLAQTLLDNRFGEAITEGDRALFDTALTQAAEEQKQLNEYVDDAIGASIPGISEYLTKANERLDETSKLIGTTPFDYLEKIPDPKMPEGIGQAKDVLAKELARLDAPDPLLAAVAEMQAMTPGFDVMRETMGFRSNEALAMFFKRNPDYYLDVMRKVRQQQGSPEFQDMIDLGSTDAMEDFLGTIKHSPPRVPYSPPKPQRRTEQAAPQTRAPLPETPGDDLEDFQFRRNLESVQEESSEPPIPEFNFEPNIESVQGASLMSPVQPDVRFARFRRQKISESAKQIQSEHQKRLGEILSA